MFYHLCLKPCVLGGKTAAFVLHFRQLKFCLPQLAERLHPDGEQLHLRLLLLSNPPLWYTVHSHNPRPLRRNK